jgi:hypothetical protein
VTSGVPIYLEVGTKRTFAGAVEWPGWCRSGPNEQDAIAALAAYADRYRRVVEASISKLKLPKDAAGFKIVKRLKGDATTEFGAPSQALPTDGEPISAAELERLTRVLDACWGAFDRATKSAAGLELRKGPRGGGRDLDKIADHVLEAEKIYTVKLGARPPKPPAGRALRASDLHAVVLAALRARARGQPVTDPSQAKNLWTPRFFTRRAAWHALDHAWEIEDRAIRRR